MSRRLPARRADEHDVVTGWRRVLSSMKRSGVTSGIKRRMRRHERHVAREQIRREQP